MPDLRALRWTRRLQAAVDQVRTLEREFAPGRDSRLPIEIAKVALANAVLAAVDFQQLPRARPARVTTVRRPRTKKRRA
ncbi:MAG TPA: hypothetical protein VE620_03335 [Myxococcales bacterium]|jgi:hypothetical protein|nr:hypothetical protein [Myxococcales bacterium]